MYRLLAIACLFVACAAAAADDPNSGSSPSTRPLTAGEIRQLLKDAPDDRPIEFGETFISQHAAADGGSGKSTGADLTQKFSSTPPSVALPGGASATGGAIDSDQSAKVSQSSAWRIGLGILGLALLAGGGWMLLGKKPPEIDTALGLAAAGGVCIAVAIWPGLLWLLAIALVCVAVSHFLPDKEKKALQNLATSAAAEITKKSEALRAAADGIAKLPVATKTAVLNSIAGEAESQHGDHETIERSVDPTLPAIRIPRDAPAGT